jgi:hypothetical protein
MLEVVERVMRFEKLASEPRTKRQKKKKAHK